MSTKTGVLGEKNPGLTLSQYQTAYKAMRHHDAMIGFTMNLGAYAIVSSAVIALNLLAVPMMLLMMVMFLLPLVGWGLGVTMHYIFGVRRLDRSLTEEQAPIEQLARKTG